MSYENLIDAFKRAVLLKKINAFDASEVISSFIVAKDKSLEQIVDDILNASLKNE